MLSVERLSVTYGRGHTQVHAVTDASFTVPENENVGLVGESGCGKTTLIKAVLRLMPRHARTTGRIVFRGRDLLGLSASEMRQLRWTNISFITQAAMNALNPVLSVERQMIEAIATHRHAERASARATAQRLFDLVGLDPGRLRDYPHQLSGGMKQRVVIAMALALDPDLVIADEPTTALDVIVQAQILTKLLDLRRAKGKSLILVTHDMSVVAQTCTRVIVMYGGRIVENGPVRDIFHAPYHPYTMGLRNAFPNVAGPKRPLVSIPGRPPSQTEAPTGCVFAARCPFAQDRCRMSLPELVELSPGHWSACLRSGIAGEMRQRAADRATWIASPSATPARLGAVSAP